MEHHFVIADVFTANPFGGNQLAVFPDARGMSDRAMLALTREFNFAESAGRGHRPGVSGSAARRQSGDDALLARASCAWSAAFGRAWASNLFLFADDGPAGENVYARMFAPSLGVAEDAATGSAAAALAGSLAETSPHRTGEFAWRIEQGVAMGRPSLILASAEKRDGKGLRVRVGGTTVIVGDGHMTTPDNY